MSNLENQNEEVMVEKKKPYNIRDRKPKEAAYRSLIRAELADELYDKILNIVVVQKKYKDPNYSAKELAKAFPGKAGSVFSSIQRFSRYRPRAA